MTMTSPSDNLNALPKLKTSFPRCRPPLQSALGALRMLCIFRAAYERDRKFTIKPPLCSAVVVLSNSACKRLDWLLIDWGEGDE